ncbi:AsmA family protein [Hoeflea sp. CAU 1731]
MKKVLAAIAALALLFAAIIYLLPLAFGTDSLRTMLARQVSSASGADITLAGPVRFSVFPDFGIVASDVAYLSADKALAANAGKVVASVRVMSLLSDRIQITGIELEKPQIILSDSAAPSSAEAPQTGQEEDVFEMAAGYLEKLAIDRFRIRDGEVLEDGGAGVRQIAGDLNLDLTVPGIEKPAKLAFSGTIDGTAMTFEGEIGSLRDLLNRQPSQFTFSGTMQPPPHPAVESVSAKGSIQLAADGSYRVADGEIMSAGQPMRLDMAYTPGARDHVSVGIRAGVLDYAAFEPEVGAGEATDATVGNSGGAPDLSALRQFDVDFDLQAEAVKAGDAVARGVAAQATLKDGELDATVISQQVAGGGLKVGVRADFNSDTPAIRGYATVTGIDIASLMQLAGVSAPVTGRLGSDVQYAFYGLDEDTIRKSVNMKGVVTIADGAAVVPELAEAIGPGAENITGLNIRAEVSDIANPVDVSGTMNWNGETVGLSTSVALAGLLSGEPGPLTVELRSKPVDARFSGTVGLDGSANGNASIETASLSGLLRWLNNDPGTPIGRFAYSGAIAASSDRVSLDNARITLDDMTATGSASVSMAGKTTITASLAVDTLDFAKLTGAGDESGAGGSSSASALASQSSTPVDLSALRDLDADIRLKAERIGYGDVKAGPATASLSVKNGVARLTIPEAGFYDGSVSAEIVADGTGTPAVEISARLANVSAMPFLDDAAGFTRLEGALDAAVALKGAGDDTYALARSLDGEARVVFSDGAIRGVDVAKLFSNVQALISSGSAQQDAGDKTEFTELSVTFTVAQGVAKTDDLKLLGPLVRMDGTGSVDLADQTIDMRLNPRVVRSLNGQGGEFDVAGLGMPIIITGPLSGPRIYPDISNILSNPAQALQTLSGLGSLVGGLAGGASGNAGSITDLLGGGENANADKAITGVIQQLGNSGGNASGETSGESGDLVNSLLQGVLNSGGSNRRDRSNRQAALPTGDGQSDAPVVREQTATTQPPAGVENLELVPPIEIVPIPQPNPLRTASVNNAPAEQPRQERSLTDQALETVLPESQDGTGDEPRDLIKNLLNQMGN